MKRTGFLFEQVIDPENLREAYWAAARSKRDRASVMDFGQHLEENVQRLRAELTGERFVFGRFCRFKIHDPKEREICAAPFAERVVHHAAMRVCGPLLDRTLIADTYACRPGKGRTAAVARAGEFARQFAWVLKLDIHRYFDSVDQTRLATALERRFKDPRLLRLFRMILGSYHTEPGRGLPIGNLTSQYFANHYLEPLDRWIKERLKRRGYVRYMDDSLVFGDSAGEMTDLAGTIDQFVKCELGLRVKENRSLHATRTGVNFLGYRLQVLDGGRESPGCTRTCVLLARRSKLRFRRRLGQLAGAWTDGTISDLEFQRRSLALSEFTRRARAVNFRRRVVGDLEIDADGLAPRGSRRQLEQRSGELPLREPERESPGQPEQQPGLSSGSGPSSTGGSENRVGGTGGDFSGRA